MYRFIVYEMYLERGCSPREASKQSRWDAQRFDLTHKTRFWLKPHIVQGSAWDDDLSYSTRMACSCLGICW
jgi:hypothetical protein